MSRISTKKRACLKEATGFEQPLETVSYGTSCRRADGKLYAGPVRRLSGTEAGMDGDNKMSSFGVLAAVPTLDEAGLMAAEGRRFVAYSPTEHDRGIGASTESGLGEAEFDSDRELEAIRGSVRSLRAQRMAVEQLKDKARHEERTVEVLKHKLREAEEEIEDLRAQGGRDVVRRLMDEVSELRARLKATSRALQAREKGAAELRQAVQELERDRRAEQTKSRAQAKKTEEQDRESRELHAKIRRLEEDRGRCEERLSSADRRAQEKSASAGRELASLSSLLGEANAALDASKAKLEATVKTHIRTLDTARKEKELLMYEKGRAQERIKELTSLCDRQRSDLAESGQHTRHLETAASAAKKQAKIAQEQVVDVRARMCATTKRREEEDIGTADKMRSVIERADRMEAELVEARAQSADKARQLAKYRDEMSTFRDDVKRLRELAAQQAEMRQAVRHRDDTIADLRHRLDLERRERQQWGRARQELLSQFCEEENKLRSTLQAEQKEAHQRETFDKLPPTGHDRSRREDRCLHRHSTGIENTSNAPPRRHSFQEKHREAGDTGDDVLRDLTGEEGRGVDVTVNGNGFRGSNRTSSDNVGVAPAKILAASVAERERSRGERPRLPT